MEGSGDEAGAGVEGYLLVGRGGGVVGGVFGGSGGWRKENG